MGQYFRKWGKCDAFRWTRIIFFVTLFGMRSFDWRDYWASAQPGQLIRNDTVFDETYEIFDFKDIYLNLAVIDVHFGIRFAPNLISIFGILLAAWVYKRF